MKKLLLLTVMGFAAAISSATAQSKFGATMRWCGTSPEFKLTGVPKGTASFELKMVDLDVPSYPHGGGKASYQAGQNAIPCNTISAGWGYNPPSPPPGQVHTYQWTIKALGANGGVLGQAVTQRKFPE
ncbi:YbhB/YbcL family Raf kinase inhibitor-like protein [Microvirga solisilvae]|uniref:YbhB/YbcL family Raf kinase inhibitor-like protein n=1 Tax=Microvirga solisilvae TaxID=2919498 RepID=UPI001FB02106|nr:hypothetical protein [Microvirga solisilvae]